MQSRTAAAASLAAVAATIFGGATKAGAATGVPGDPVIATDSGIYVNGYPAPLDHDPTLTVQDPNGNWVTINPTLTTHTETWMSSTHDGPMTQVADITQTATPGQPSAPAMTPAFGSTSPAGAQALSVNTTWSGCAETDSYTEASTAWGPFNQIFYRYHLNVKWCGNGAGAVSKPSYYDYPTDVQFGISYQGRVADNGGQYYNAWPGLGNYTKSGYSVFTEGKFDLIPIPPFGTPSDLPWVHVIVFADGATWNDQGFG